ncbi:ThiF family adenylyltransferase [Neisseria iguanae]|uniref:ThiF family adenylyltransferase n=1 Tax=Neisseria iguanae TaxID=90242 RepID=UPI0014742B5C|nr:ThiF family adenylyltransferase [Neisseria iguanae]
MLDEPVQFVHTQQLDFKKSVLRYLPAQSPQGLLNKKVLLVGLGAIGGYMADALTKIGAGIESDFVLVDKDQFLAENVSRHLLGLLYCGQFKASAIKQHLAENTFFQQKKFDVKLKTSHHLIQSFLRKTILI